MSLPPDPFNIDFHDNLGMLAGISTSLVGLRMFQGTVYPSAVVRRTNINRVRAGSVSQTKMKTKYSRKRASRKVATIASVRRMLNVTMEKKQLNINRSVAPLVADTNKIHTFNITSQIAQGQADGQRIGDSIFLENIVFNAQFVTNLKPAFYKYRLIIGWSGEDISPSVWSISGLSTSEVFINGWTLVSNAIVNTKAFTPIYDNMIEINSLLDTFSDGKTIRGVCRLNQKFHYQSPGSTFGKTKNLYVLLVPFYIQSSGTAPTDIGGIHMDVVVRYKDA